MRQFTTPDQTAKLIELAFEKPRIDAGVTKWEGYEPICTGSYTLGELIEMLPENSSKRIRYVATKRAWVVDVDVLGKSGCAKCYRDAYHAELIDALYDMVIKLKDEGVI